MIENLGLYDIVIDLKNISRYTNSTNIYYKEGDINTAKIRARLKNKDININLIGVTVFIKIETPISKIEDEVTVIDAENGIIEYTFSTNALVQGANFFELILVKDGNVKVSQRLAYKVLDSIDDGDIESTNEYPILIQLISKAEKLIEDNESIKLNESIRIADEDTRKSNETKRQTSESTRESQEITRQQSITNMQNQFNALAPTESTNAEVQLARTDIMGKTHVSLQERLISDNKAQNTLFEEINGSHISTDTTEGYISDLVIEGNTIQDENNLADIRSVGDKVEGQELYKIPLLCTGKNIYPYGDIKTSWNNNSSESITGWVKVKPNTTYIVSRENIEGLLHFIEFIDNKKSFKNHNDCYSKRDGQQFAISTGGKSRTLITSPGINYIMITSSNDSVDSKKTYQKNIQIEEGTQATPYEPYQEHKLTILSPTQIEKVGDVADRIIEKDGVWGVEDKSFNVKNVGKNIINIALEVRVDTNPLLTKVIIARNDVFKSAESMELYVKGKNLKRSTSSTSIEYKFDYDKNVGYTWFTVPSSCLNMDLSNLSDGDIFIRYSTGDSFIPLPNSQQIKLRTLPNKTNISFLTEIEGAIKGKVPKSLSATVNTHTTQIDNLNTDLERVKKLEESTVSTVKNDGKDFVSVESTNQGYFEDVRLEGKTLVNLFTLVGSGLVVVDNNMIYANINLDKKDITSNKNMTVINNTNRQIIVDIYENGKWKRSEIIRSYNPFKTITTIPTEYIRVIYCQSSDGWGITDADKDLLKNTLIVIDGHLTKSPSITSYFEGLKSVGEGTDEIVVSSVDDGNIISDLNIQYGKYYYNSPWANGLSISKMSSNNARTSTKMSVTSNTPYYIEATNGNRGIINFFDDINSELPYNGINLGYNSPKGVFKTDERCKFIEVYMYNDIEPSNIYLCTGDSLSIKPHKSNKKPLLRYNDTTQIWEKPILREWDYVEKRSDEDYYNIEKSGQVVLDGSENWNVYGTDVNTVGLSYNLLAKPMSEGICDIIPFIKTGAGDKLHCMINNSGILLLWIEKNKLETQDVAGFKKWLQTNPVTVTYQLATPKEYKCTNIDLISYPNETNLYINSGPITPNLTAKYHGNIANSMIILQNKVSLLENKFMNGLKSVLAGNMQDLAYSLYPNDFNMSTTLEL